MTTGGPPTELVSIRQAARDLRIGERIVRQAVRSGELKGHKLGARTIRVEMSDVRDWVRGKRVATWRPS